MDRTRRVLRTDNVYWPDWETPASRPTKQAPLRRALGARGAPVHQELPIGIKRRQQL